ncbi:myosin-2-like [Clarias gariepinus]|uniref:myosin-2-like n=1 Tax=Clarias gariepinus TaxID=13013 RepID=UPI00234C3FA0|nr:myosin-2-like [Clarias gariepinus]
MAAETTAQMEAEKSELADQVGTLQDTVRDLRKGLGQAQAECDELKNACAQKREAQVQTENDELKEKLKLSEALLIEYERDREAWNLLQVEYEEMKETLMHDEEQLKFSLAEAEEELQNAAETTAEIEAEKSELADQVGMLQDTVEDLRKLLCQAHTECDELKNESAQERESHSIVQGENDELKKKLKLSEALLIEYERDREACNLLKVEYEEMKKTLTHNQELLNVSLLKADEKLQKAAETTPQSELSDQLGTLEDTVQDLRKQLRQAHTECDELKHASAKERETHSIVQAENDDLKEKLKLSEALIIEYERDQEACNLLQVQYGKLKKTLSHNEKLLKESAQEREVYSIVQAENDELKEKLKLSEALLMEYKQEREACNLLPSENEEVKKTHIEELLKVSLVEAEKELQNSETPAQMEAEKSVLPDQVGTLQDAVQDLRKQLCQTQTEFEKLKNESTQERKVHSIVQTENNELKEKLKFSEALLMEYERDQEACNILQVEYKEMKANLIQSEESLKVSLAEAEEELQKATETTAQVEAEKSELADQVRTLQDTVQDLRKLLIQANESAQERETHSIVQAEKLKLSEALLMEYERDREASNILQVEYEEMKKTLMHNEEQLKVSLAEADAELQRATETTAQMKAEKSELSDQVGTLQDTVQDLKNLLCQTQIECDELKKSAQEREAHSIVQAENDELKEKLKLSEALLIEYERDREAWNLLQVEYKEMKATLTQNEEQLKVNSHHIKPKHYPNKPLLLYLQVSLAKAEEKHRKAMETIAQLKAQKSDLGDEVCTLQETVENMGTLLCESQKDCDRLTDEYERELEARNLLQFEHEEVKVAMTYSEEVLKGSLAEAEAKYHKATETIAQLEAQKSDLRDEVNTLQEALQNMGTLLREADCDELRDESQVSRAEPERNHQNIDETLARLAAEKSDLADKIKRLQDTVQKLGNLLYEAHRDLDEQANKYEQVQEAHNILQSNYNELKESLKHKEELLKKHGVTFGSKKTTDVQTGGSVDMNGFSLESMMNMQYKE